jgi:hypothetical protein
MGCAKRITGAPIRSFLIDSAPPTSAKAQPVQKIFDGGGYDTARTVALLRKPSTDQSRRRRALRRAIGNRSKH